MSKEHELLLNVVEDLSGIKSIVPQLQATFNILMTKTPTQERYQYLSNIMSSDVSGEAASTVEKVQALIQTPQTKVSVRLKELHDMGKLPLLTALSKIGFKLTLPEQERELGAFLDIVPTEEENSGKKALFDPDAPKLSVDYFSYPPTLPFISDQLLLIRVSTDKSYRQPSDFIELTSEKFTNSHNAKLALRGQAQMELMLFDLLNEKFPNLFEKDLLMIRDRFMSSEILAKFAFGYNLVDVMKYNLSVDVNDEAKMEACANIFLAYIAGLQVDGYDFEDIKSWLKALYQPLLSDSFASTTPVAKVALIEFESLLKLITNVNRYPQSIVDYEFLEVQTDPYVVQLIVGQHREVFGVGMSNTSYDDAKDRAVMDVMEDQTKIVRIFTIIKHQYIKSGSGGENDSRSTLGELPMDDIVFPNSNRGSAQVNYIAAAPHSSRLPSVSSSQLAALYISGGTIDSVSNLMVNEMSSRDQSQAMTRYSQQSPPPQASYSQKQQQQQQRMYEQSQGYGQGYGQSRAFGRVSPQCTYTPLSERHNPYQSSGGYPSLSHGHPDYEVPLLHETIPLSHRDIDMHARSDLYAMLGPLQLKPEYKLTHDGSQYFSLCTCNGIDLGAGIDTSKQKAAQKSAMAALSNRSGLIRLGVTPRN